MTNSIDSIFRYDILKLPVVASAQGGKVDDLIVLLHLLMAALFVGWMAYFIYVLWRFRKSKNPKADYVGARSHASTWIEIAVAVVEAFLLIGIAVPMWAATVGTEQFPDLKTSTVIRIVGQQFGWNAFYPGIDGEFGRHDVKMVSADNPFGSDPKDPKGKDDFKTFNDINVPINKPVVIYVSSLDVIHSFKVYPMRINQDAIPGLSVPLHFTPTMLGRFQVVCAQLCGSGHYSMRGILNVLSAEDYKKWLAEKSKGGGATSFE
jgi:cytochrome c oxidase subunit 2